MRLTLKHDGHHLLCSTHLVLSQALVLSGIIHLQVAEEGAGAQERWVRRGDCSKIQLTRMG
jgi:hypothetical protein